MRIARLTSHSDISEESRNKNQVLRLTGLVNHSFTPETLGQDFFLQLDGGAVAELPQPQVAEEQMPAAQNQPVNLLELLGQMGALQHVQEEVQALIPQAHLDLANQEQLLQLQQQEIALIAEIPIMPNNDALQELLAQLQQIAQQQLDLLGQNQPQ